MTTEDMAAALWCEACEHWKHEHPAGLPCPWHQDLKQPNPDLDLDPEEEPKRVIDACEADLGLMRGRKFQLLTIRARAARAALARPDRAATAREMHHQVKILERWAAFGIQAIPRPRPPKHPRETARQRLAAESLAAGRQKIEERLALRETLLEQRQVDLRSKNLLPPLPEGGGQPQRR